MRGFPRILIVIGLVSVLAAGLASCQKEAKKTDVLSPDEMVKVMTEIYLGEHKVTRLSLTSDSSKVVFEKIKGRIFDKAGTTDSLFKKSFDYYVDRPEELEVIYSMLVDSLNLKEQQLNVSLGQAVK